MSYPAVLSVAQQSTLDSSTVVIDKPSGLSLGDIMFAVIGSFDSGDGVTGTMTTPAGWTQLRIYNGDSTDTSRIVAYQKTASSDDVAASNFSFTGSRTFRVIAGVILRFSPSDISSVQSEIDNGVAAASFVTALTPASPESTVLLAFLASDKSITGTPSIGSYTTTPSVTFTEHADMSIKNGFDDGIFFGVASGSKTGTTEITSRGATASETASEESMSILLIINGTYNQSGTAALHSADADFFVPTASSGTSGTTVLHTADADFFDQSGAGTSPTIWTPQPKEDTDWTKQDKS